MSCESYVPSYAKGVFNSDDSNSFEKKVGLRKFKNYATDVQLRAYEQNEMISTTQA
jgi:hypothetical protein